jgi:hypothetical protein
VGDGGAPATSACSPSWTTSNTPAGCGVWYATCSPRSRRSSVAPMRSLISSLHAEARPSGGPNPLWRGEKDGEHRLQAKDDVGCDKLDTRVRLGGRCVIESKEPHMDGTSTHCILNGSWSGRVGLQKYEVDAP